MPVALVVRVAAEEPEATVDAVADAELDTDEVTAGVALMHAEVVTVAQGVAVAERRGEFEVEEDAVVDRENTTDTEVEPESDLEPLREPLRAALVVARAVTEEEPVPENVDSAEPL